MSLCLAVVAVAWPLRAGAEQRALVGLVYERGPGAAHCPGEPAIRGGVTARLGYEPFAAGAGRTVHASVAGTGRGLRARVELRDATGAVLGERELVSEQHDCTELAAAMELAIAIAIDPVTALRSEARASPAAPASPPLRLFATLGALGAFGFAPAPTAGATIAGGVRRGWTSLGLEARADLPASMAVGRGSISSWLLLAALVPCAHHRVLGACAIVAGGAQRGAGRDLVGARQATLPFLALGGRVALELPVRGPIFGRLHADLVVPLARGTLQVNARDVWTGTAVEGAVGGAIGVYFR
ncbi:MAG TPA: hypothetical protein VGQ83_31050 [Polyangia bacterium]